MRGLLGLSCAACLAVAIVALPKTASATPAASAIAYGQTNAGLAEEVGRRWYRRRYVRRPYRYGRYAYRPYYYRPYYRPYYGGWGWGRPYWRRPGFGIWLGF